MKQKIGKNNFQKNEPFDTLIHLIISIAVNNNLFCMQNTNAALRTNQEVYNMNKTDFTKKVLEAEATLYHVAKSILLYDRDCEDAVQEAILKAYEKLNTLRDETYFKTWLTRILINECYRIQRSSRPAVPYEDYLLDQTSADKKDYSDLYHAITQLPPRIRVTVVLYYVDGYSVEEIKEILSIPAGTVKSRLAKGRKLLKKQLLQMEVTYG